MGWGEGGLERGHRLGGSSHCHGMYMDGLWMWRGGLERGHGEGRSDNCNGMYKMAVMGWGEGSWKKVTGKGGVTIVTGCIRWLVWDGERGSGKRS